MVGIVSYGAYIPYYRLRKDTAAQAFGKRAGKGAKAVAYCDEDSITMSVAAAINAMNGLDASRLSAVYFASSTSPYQEKLCAAEVAAALDADLSLRAADFSNSLRACSNAVFAAAENVTENGGNAMVTMSDCRLGAADGKFETDLGDAAAAFVIGTEDLLATIDGKVSVCRDAADQWRADDDIFVRNWDPRYANTQLYTPLVTKAVKELLAKLDLQPADFSKIVLYGHDDKTRTALAAKLGFQPEQIVGSLYSSIGNSGNAAAGIMLCAALDTAKAGERILVVTYGEGCDAAALTVTEKADGYRPLRSVETLLAHMDDSLPYGKYLKWKGMIPVEPQKRPAQERSALPDYYRNYKKNHAFYGCRCTQCGTPFFPPQRVCVHCHAIDKMEPYRFFDKKARIRTFTIDGLSVSLDSPNILVVLEFEGGGKLMTYLVDCKKEDVRVGMPVRPTFRKMFKANGISTYFWKVVPAEEEAQV